MWFVLERWPLIVKRSGGAAGPWDIPQKNMFFTEEKLEIWQVEKLTFMLDNPLGGKAAFRCFRGGLDVVNAVPAYFCQSIEARGETSAPADDAR